MAATFYDRQDEHNPLNGSQLAFGAAVHRIIDEFSTRRPFFCELIGENGYKLLLGIGKNIGCAQHSACDGRPPYLMAVGDSVLNFDDCGEYLIGNTLTPVPRRYCVPIDTVKQIASYFIETWDRYPEVRWEEI
ncbi:MAG TPA: hypothetical protein VH684_20150 [Xanthobacteraceae bacterium]|jgi:hypothetical protein